MFEKLEQLAKDNKKISETLDNSFFLKKISEKFANKGFNF